MEGRRTIKIIALICARSARRRCLSQLLEGNVAERESVYGCNTGGRGGGGNTRARAYAHKKKTMTVSAEQTFYDSPFYDSRKKLYLIDSERRDIISAR